MTHAFCDGCVSREPRIASCRSSAIAGHSKYKSLDEGATNAPRSGSRLGWSAERW